MPTYSYTIAEIMVNRRAWFVALNDPENGQVEGKLADSEFTSFCCLGVAADKVPALSCTRSYEGSFSYTLNDAIAEGYEDNYGHTVTLDADLHWEILAKLGLNQEMQTFLIGLNDTAKMLFPAIGDVMMVMPIVGASDGDDAIWDQNKFLEFNLGLFTEASPAWLLSRLTDALDALGVANL